ncbi:MAG: ABC transporter permease [Acidobacteriota bacterium]
MKRARWPVAVLFACLLFFYAPLAVLVANSFNASRAGTIWAGFTLRWYRLLLENREVWAAVSNTLIVATTATLASIVLGTLAAFALHRWKTRLQTYHFFLVYTPLVIPDILMGMSLLILFVSFGVRLSLGTVILAHITFCLSYVALVVLARLQDFDMTLIEAARDLGAGPWLTFRRILLPLLAPGILAGGLLAFTLSIDDFVITFFVAGPGSTTLPIQIYSMMRFGSPPLINALSTILLTVTFVVVLISRRLGAVVGVYGRPEPRARAG